MWLEKYSDMLNMKALVGIWIFYGSRAWVISVLIVPYLKGIWISIEYMLNLILSARGARGARGCRSAQALPRALKNVSFTRVKYKLLPLKCTHGITGSPYLGMLPMHSGPLISKTPWKPQIIVKSLRNLLNNLPIRVNH